MFNPFSFCNIVLVDVTRKPIEFIDEIPILSLLQKLEPILEVKSPRGRELKSPRVLAKTVSVSLMPAKKKPIKDFPSKPSFENISNQTLYVRNNGIILSSINFSLFPFAEVFSSHVTFKTEENLFIFTAGTMEDILHYIILHSGSSYFGTLLIRYFLFYCEYKTHKSLHRL